MSPGTPIPSVARLVWIGARLAPVAWLTARATLARAGLERVVLHVEAPLVGPPPLDGDALADDLRRAGVQVVPFQLDDLIDASGLTSAESGRLRGLGRDLRQGAARSNLARLLILNAEGGIYLDTDAPPLRALTPLLQHRACLGLERVALPLRTMASRSPIRWARAGALLAWRELCSHGDLGERLGERTANLFDLAVNNAVIGAAPGSELLVSALQTAAALPDEVARERYQLGPKLLERVTGNRSGPEVEILPPEVCYPFGPELSWHLFRPRPQPRQSRDALAGEALLQLLPSACRVVHLYDSVLRRRQGCSLDGAWLDRHRDDTIVGALLAPYVDELCALDPGRADVAR